MAGSEEKLEQVGKLIEKKQFSEAEHNCHQMLDSEPENRRALALLARTCLMQQKFDEASNHYSRCMNSGPESGELLREYAHAVRMAGRVDEALSILKKAAECENPYPAYLDLAGLWMQQEVFEDAKSAFKEALRLNPKCAVSLEHLMRIAALQQDHSGYVHYCERFRQLQPMNFRLYPMLITGYLRNREPDKALALCEECMKKDPSFLPLVSFKYIACSELGDKDGVAYLAGFDRLVKKFSVEPPSSFSTTEAFNFSLVDHIKHHCEPEDGKEKYTTKCGWQTKAETLFKNNPQLGKQLFETLERRVNAYIEELPADPGHPLNLSRPKNYKIESWAVVLGKGGHQGPHMHPKSWISGCYYVALPDDFDRQPVADAGHIVFGQGEYDLHPIRKPETVTLKPVAGSVVLFPGYLWHHTVPLESTQERICIAFDLVSA